MGDDLRCERVTGTVRAADASAGTLARTAGYLYLVLLMFGPVSMVYVPSRLVVAGDATATAGNVLGSELLFRASLVGDAVVFLTEIALAAVLYLLFEPVSRPIALIAAFSRLAMATIQAGNLLLLLAALMLLDSPGYLTDVFEMDQLQASALLLMNAHAEGGYVWGAFFGMHCGALAVLLFRSGYFPRALGVLMAIAAFGYLTNSLGNFVLPEYRMAFGAIAGAGVLLGEFPLMFWLLFRSADVGDRALRQQGQGRQLPSG